MTRGIYKITCVPTGRVYVGASVDVENRWKQHLSDLRKEYHCNPHLQRAFLKHGESAFEFSILQECSDLIPAEIHWIRELTPEFNLTSGGEPGNGHSAEFMKEMLKMRWGDSDARAKQSTKSRVTQSRLRADWFQRRMDQYRGHAHCPPLPVTYLRSYLELKCPTLEI